MAGRRCNSRSRATAMKEELQHNHTVKNSKRRTMQLQHGWPMKKPPTARTARQQDNKTARTAVAAQAHNNDSKGAQSHKGAQRCGHTKKKFGGREKKNLEVRPQRKPSLIP
ncbi:OLC1v1004368C1 [Oldenlandia corymbosa var. corymbosa]|uniref:OLC1v1004368C1 n=1 Tax=Oldenlandia corymbosa var. corymbosa TaxID=529605 RepID=A0AAV1DCT2_OLDCO|nr:OLC1v1004368C1 [Oldenlandia corymbosa var. corymbosa]